MSSLTDDLNDSQREAVLAAPGPLVIIAGPGTGKTKTLTARIAHLIQSQQAVAPTILALTFTKKAAEEMRQRVARLLPATSANAPHISTFHALCHELLGDRNLQFITEPQRLQVIKQLARPESYKGLSAREVGLLISRYKNQAEDSPVLGRLVHAYDAALGDLGLLDFDDILLRAKAALQQRPALRQTIQKRFTHILVDEFQDTNRLQYELLQLMCGTDNLFVIGDPQQSIYGFRGASGDIFEQFRSDFPQATQISLQINYRSAQAIVRLSNALFTTAPDLQAHNSQEGSARTVEVLNEYSEAAWIVREIHRAIGGGDMLQAHAGDGLAAHRTLGEFAIIYRNRRVAAAVQKAIRESGLPYQIVGEGSPYEQPHVQIIIGLLGGACSGELPKLEGFTAGQAAGLQNLLGQTDGVLPHLLAERVIDVLGIEPTASLQHFVATLVRFQNVQQAVDYFNTIAETNFYDPAADAITLLTIHASKGLEFAHVFLIGAEEGTLPYSTPAQKTGQSAPPAIDEEKRLFYVAVTRAKDQLDILHAQKRAGDPQEPSRFITETSPLILPRQTDPYLEADQRRARKRAAKHSQQSLF